VEHKNIECLKELLWFQLLAERTTAAIARHATPMFFASNCVKFCVFSSGKNSLSAKHLSDAKVIYRDIQVFETKSISLNHILRFVILQYY
jgi:hypothetical protein